MDILPKVEKVIPIVQGFLNYLKKAAPEASAKAEEHWSAYKPELKKCKTKEEVARLLLSYYERTMKSIKDIDGRKFVRVKSVGTKKLRIALFTLGVNKNTVRDYVSQIFKIEGRPVEETPPGKEKRFERKAAPKGAPSPAPAKKVIREKPAPRKRMVVVRHRLTGDMVAAGIFAILLLALFVGKLL